MRTSLIVVVTMVLTLAAAAFARDRAGPGYRRLSLPVAPAAGEGRELSVLLDAPGLRISTLTLRKGAKLEERALADDATVEVLYGRGRVAIDGDVVVVDGAHMLVIDAGVAHVVEADASTDLILLVQEHRRAGRGGPAPGAAR
jgi:quercetin dioxygenase-like cupin family protein